MSSPNDQEDLNAVIRQHPEWLAAQLHGQGESLFPPDAAKQMRRFTSGEAAVLLGVNDSYLRKLHMEGKGPVPELTPGNRRLYSVLAGTMPTGSEQRCKTKGYALASLVGSSARPRSNTTLVL